MLKSALNNKKIGLIIVVTVFYFLIITGISWADNTWYEGYRVNHSGGVVNPLVGSANGTSCYQVINNNAVNDYFIPTKTLAEWNNFYASLPSGVTVSTTCSTPPNAQCYIIPGSCTTGNCIYTQKANGTSCNDGNICTTGDICSNGVCSGSNTNMPNGCYCTVSTQCSSSYCQP